MRTLPSLVLAARTLRQDARASRQHVLRIGLVLALLFALWAVADRSSWFGAPGLWFFERLVDVDFWVVTAFGVSVFSAAIAEEREQRGLGLLALAGFGHGGILLGKSIGMLTSTLLLLSVQLPFAALAVALGGITVHQVLAAFVMLGAWTVALFGLGLFASTVCLRTASAARLSFVLVVAVLAGPPLLRLLVLDRWPDASLATWLDLAVAAGVWSSLSRVVATGFEEPLLGPPLLANVGLGVAAAATAWIAFRARPLDDAESVAAARARVNRRGSRSRPRPGAAALAWKDWHFLGRGRRGVFARLALYAAVAAAVPTVFDVHGDQAAAAIAWCTFLLVALESCFLAARTWSEEVRARTLADLVLLPSPLAQLAWAKIGAVATIALPGLAGVVAAMLLALGTSHVSELEGLGVLSTFLIGNWWLGAHLAALFSLRVPRAALPLALLTLVGVAMALFCLAFTLASDMRSGGWFCMTACHALAMFGLGLAAHAMTLSRLRSLAGK